MVVAPYEMQDGRLRATIPAEGPCRDPDGQACRISYHHVRHRKTGIPWRYLDVAYCKTHGGAFTLYPPGHVPYGREPLVLLGPDGHELASEEANEPPTYPDAARDAKAGRLWPREGAPDPPGAVRTTQRRRIRVTASILGLAPHSPLDVETAAAAGDLAAGQLVEARGRLAVLSCLVAWGREVWEVFTCLGEMAGRARFERLAVLGHHAGRWGRCFGWDAKKGRLCEWGRPFRLAKERGTHRTPPARGPAGGLHERSPPGPG